MVEDLKSVIARLKAQQTSQQSKPSEPTRPVGRPPKNIAPEPIESVEEEDFDDDEEISPSGQKLPPLPPKQEVQAREPVKEEISPEQRIAMEIEVLQNNGRFRGELLHQLQEIKQALVVVAGVLVDLSGGDKK